MRQVFLERGVVVVKQVAQPLLDDYSVLVAVRYSCISSGAEVETIASAKQLKLFGNVPQKVKKVIESLGSTGSMSKTEPFSESRTLGYSCSGVVIAVGRKVIKLRSGDFVACAGSGFAHHADIVCVPEYLVVRIGKHDKLKHASLTAIGAMALQGVRRAQVQLGEIVCVMGLGLMGQLTLQLAKLSGCKVIGIDVLPERLALATALGADAVYHGSDDDVQKMIEFFTLHNGVDATIITATTPRSNVVQQAMQVTRKKGRVVAVGEVGLTLERNPFYEKEIDFLSVCSYGVCHDGLSQKTNQADCAYAYAQWTERRNMQAFLDLIERGAIPVDKLIGDQVGLEEIAKAYDTLHTKKTLGAFVYYNAPKEMPLRPFSNNQTPNVQPQQQGLFFTPAVKDTFRVGVVGAGGFAKVTLIPMIAKMHNAKIRAIVDANIGTSLTVSRQFGSAAAFVDDAQLLQQDLVDVVVISSPHKYHCAQALRALGKGKAVFMEKPMATNNEQLKQFKEFLFKNPTLPFCVDYNRSFSPFIQKIKHVIAGRTTPLMIHYRMNAGFIPKEHWIQTEIGAGRIIGEACHIFDLFCYLTEAKPVSVSVEALHAADDALFPTDNFTAHITFSDGSICSLFYTALGSRELGVEHMELFYDSKSIVMDDYLSLKGFGLPKTFDETVRVADTGHAALLNLFFEGIAQPAFKHPIPLDRLNTVAELTLLIDRLACEGGGHQQI